MSPEPRFGLFLSQASKPWSRVRDEFAMADAQGWDHAWLVDHLVDTDGPPELPMTPGREVAGVVDQLGEGTDPSWLGRPVVVRLGQASGGYATTVVAAAEDLFPLGDEADFAAAVAMIMLAVAITIIVIQGRVARGSSRSVML